MQPISISYPIKKSNDGFFERTYTSIDTYAANINILLRTMEGELPFDPDFGLPILSKLFNPNTSSLKDYIVDVIKQKIKKYIPEVIINDITVITDNEKLSFKLFISVPQDQYNIYEISIGLN
ncbi:MAG TPA: GPW/gp25 family protein [Thermotogota bacterium]|nr:GPW/gp25 family protein [Thermotogota bacterium]